MVKIYFYLCQLKKILFRYLLDFKANVAAVNNDGELAIDIRKQNRYRIIRNIIKPEVNPQKTGSNRAPAQIWKHLIQFKVEPTMFEPRLMF